MACESEITTTVIVVIISMSSGSLFKVYYRGVSEETCDTLQEKGVGKDGDREKKMYSMDMEKGAELKKKNSASVCFLFCVAALFPPLSLIRNACNSTVLIEGTVTPAACSNSGGAMNTEAAGRHKHSLPSKFIGSIGTYLLVRSVITCAVGLTAYKGEMGAIKVKFPQWKSRLCIKVLCHGVFIGLWGKCAPTCSTVACTYFFLRPGSLVSQERAEV